jgi:hypothetical protein
VRTKSPPDSERLRRYVERSFARAKKERFPTVRQGAHALGWTQSRVAEAIDGDPDGQLFTTQYFTVWETPFGEMFIETYG